MSILKQIRYIKEKINEVNFVKTKKFLKQDLSLIKDLLDTLTNTNIKVSTKLSRNILGYQESSKEGFAQCSTCLHFIEDTSKCELLSNKDKIKPPSGCIRYIEDNASNKPIEEKSGNFRRKFPLEIYNKEEVRFFTGDSRCENCTFYNKDCCEFMEKLNYMLPNLVEMDNKVKATGFCSAFTQKI